MEHAENRAVTHERQARLAAIDKMQEQVIDDDEKELTIQIPAGPPLGDLVVRAEGVKKGFGDILLYDDMTFNLPKGGIVGIIGPNGAGKSTLFRGIVGMLKPLSGSISLGGAKPRDVAYLYGSEAPGSLADPDAPVSLVHGDGSGSFMTLGYDRAGNAIARMLSEFDGKSADDIRAQRHERFLSIGR